MTTTLFQKGWHFECAICATTADHTNFGILDLLSFQDRVRGGDWKHPIDKHLYICPHCTVELANILKIMKTVAEADAIRKALEHMRRGSK